MVTILPGDFVKAKPAAARLLRLAVLDYTTEMNDIVWLLSVGVVGGGLLLARALWRRRRAAKLADHLLDEVVKAKDAFRR
jgi:hypothetical protein